MSKDRIYFPGQGAQKAEWEKIFMKTVRTAAEVFDRQPNCLDSI